MGNRPLPLTEEAVDGGLILGDAHTKRDQKRARWARAVFHSVLAIDLKARGGASAEQLYHRLSWFMLPFNRNEIFQILDSARRNGIVKQLDDGLDAFGRVISGEWVLTEDGGKLKRPRALALPDLGRGAVSSSTAGFSTAFTSIKGLLLGLAPYLTVLFGVRLDSHHMARWILAVAGALVLGIVLGNGVVGDLKLREAARSWPRMREKRPSRHKYQLSRARLVFIPAAMGVVYLTAAVGLVLSVAMWKIAIPCIGEILVVVFIYLDSLLPMRQEWSQGDRDLLLWEEKWRLRGPWKGPTIVG
jgi:hypothetical protein